MALAPRLDVTSSFGQWPMPVLEWERLKSEPSVVVADDDDAVLEVITFKLESVGYRVITADNGTKALDLVHSEQPDAVILDVSMPGMDGLSVCTEMQNTESTAQIPVLFVSGRDRSADIDLGFGAGAGDYLVKPFKPTDLLRRLRWLMLTNPN